MLPVDWGEASTCTEELGNEVRASLKLQLRNASGSMCHVVMCLLCDGTQVTEVHTIHVFNHSIVLCRCCATLRMFYTWWQVVFSFRLTTSPFMELIVGLSTYYCCTGHNTTVAIRLLLLWWLVSIWVPLASVWISSWNFSHLNHCAILLNEACFSHSLFVFDLFLPFERGCASLKVPYWCTMYR